MTGVTATVRQKVERVSFTIEADATRYVVTTFESPSRLWLLCDQSGYATGTWMELPKAVQGDTRIAWSYLQEKLDLREGDRAGWSAAIEAALDVEVF